MKKITNTITLRFHDANTLDRLDHAATGLSMNRSDYIRRCVMRGLEETENHELPLLEHRAIRKALAR